MPQCHASDRVIDDAAVPGHHLATLYRCAGPAPKGLTLEKREIRSAQKVSRVDRPAGIQVGEIVRLAGRCFEIAIKLLFLYILTTGQ